MKQIKIIITDHSLERWKERFKFKKTQNFKHNMIQTIQFGIQERQLLQCKKDANIKYMRVGNNSYFVLNVSQTDTEIVYKALTFVDRSQYSDWIEFLLNKVKLY